MKTYCELDWRTEEEDITGKRVSEGVAQKYIQSSLFDGWGALYPVLISTPTGSGKTSFVYDDLVPYAQQKNRNILLISNRVALGFQQKRILCEKIKIGYYSRSELNDMCIFGNVMVTSYHSILGFLNNPRYANFFLGVGYVIFDEAHFFISDSRFNNQTEKILKSIIERFKWSIRIYMTATPDQVEGVIIEYENFCLNNKMRELGPDETNSEGVNDDSSDESKSKRNMFSNMTFHLSKTGPTMYKYTAKGDYSDYQFKFFNEWKMLAHQISISRSEEKWLIFITSKDDKNNIMNALKGVVPSDKIEYIDAEEKDGDVYSRIVNKEQFRGRVLIATSVIDNGINFNDPLLKHIVIDPFDKVSTIQMVGRKRRKENEQVSLYFKVPEYEQLHSRCNIAKGNWKLITQFVDNQHYFWSHSWGNLDKNEQRMFYYDKSMGKLVPNSLARKKIGYDIDFLNDLMEAWLEDESCGIQKEILTWFGKKKTDFVEGMQIRDDCGVLYPELMELLERYVEELGEFGEDKVKVVMDEFAQEFKASTKKKIKYYFEKKNGERYVENTNKKLEEYNIKFRMIRTCGDRGNRKWKFERIEEETATLKNDEVE